MAKLFLNTIHQSDILSNPERPKILGSGFVTSVIGEGGAAVVYEIWNPKLEIHRAVKLWRPHVSEKDLQRFETEIKITSKLDHPNIVEIHSVGEWNGLPYIEMERIEGLSLQHILKTNGALPPLAAIAIMIFICRALQYAHNEEFSLYGRKRKGVIHCDIKPANIMITRSGLVKLMDFGIANPTNVSLHTAADRVSGSLQYMAPEQIRSRQIDCRTDIYSSGVVLYEMLSGTRAFPSKQLLEVIEKRKSNDFVPLNQFCINLPRRFHRMVSRCMQLEPEDRYQSVQELLKELSSIFKNLSNGDPQTVLQQFLETGTVNVQKIRISRNILVPVIAAVIPTILLVITLVMIVFKNDRVKTTEPIINSSNATVEEMADPSISAKQEDIDASKDRGGTEAAFDNNEELSMSVAADNSPEKSVSEPEAPLSDAEWIVRLGSMIENGDVGGAMKQLAVRKINDGAYYYYYARCFYECGEWEKAFTMAEIATRVSSKYMDRGSRNGQHLHYKAKYLSSVFDNTKEGSDAEAAIASWQEVMDYFGESTKGAFAESEISRITSFFQDTSNASQF